MPGIPPEIEVYPVESMEMLGIRPPQATPRPLYRDTIA